VTANPGDWIILTFGGSFHVATGRSGDRYPSSA
jgi:hypothetical protein